MELKELIEERCRITEKIEKLEDETRPRFVNEFSVSRLVKTDTELKERLIIDKQIEALRKYKEELENQISLLEEEEERKQDLEHKKFEESIKFVQQYIGKDSGNIKIIITPCDYELKTTYTYGE